MNTILRTLVGILFLADITISNAQEQSANTNIVSKYVAARDNITLDNVRQEDIDWNSTVLKNTAQDYIAFLKHYPNTARIKHFTGTLQAAILFTQTDPILGVTETHKMTEGGALFENGSTKEPTGFLFAKGVTLTMNEHPEFKATLPVKDAITFDLINHQDAGTAEFLIIKPPINNATVLTAGTQVLAVLLQTQYEFPETQTKVSNTNSVGQEDSTQTHDLLTLFTNINQHSANAVTKSAGQTVGGMDGRGATMIQLLKEYGYNSESLLFSGDVTLLDKTLIFTRDCAKQGFIESNDGIALVSTPPVDTESAISFLLKTFTPTERIAIQYEITSPKASVVDDRRATLLRESGYDATQIKLKSNAVW